MISFVSRLRSICPHAITGARESPLATRRILYRKSVTILRERGFCASMLSRSERNFFSFEKVPFVPLHWFFALAWARISLVIRFTSFMYSVSFGGGHLSIAHDSPAAKVARGRRERHEMRRKRTLFVRKFIMYMLILDIASVWYSWVFRYREFPWSHRSYTK